MSFGANNYAGILGLKQDGSLPAQTEIRVNEMDTLGTCQVLGHLSLDAVHALQAKVKKLENDNADLRHILDYKNMTEVREAGELRRLKRSIDAFLERLSPSVPEEHWSERHHHEARIRDLLITFVVPAAAGAHVDKERK
jgi:hypothetical protein